MRRKFIDMTGKEFGQLVVIERSPEKDPTRSIRWVCRCKLCGKFKTVNGSALRAKRMNSCECTHGEHHGKSFGSKNFHPLYRVWGGIKARCTNPNHNGYPNYGGRGITVCDSWMFKFSTFFNWCLENGWKESLQIDRINNDGNYCSENCRFVTPRKNCLNQRLIRTSNSSGYRGISWDKERKKWVSYIQIKKKQFFLGRFMFKRDALDTRNNYITENNLQDDYQIQEWAG